MNDPEDVVQAARPELVLASSWEGKQGVVICRALIDGLALCLSEESGGDVEQLLRRSDAKNLVDFIVAQLAATGHSPGSQG